MENKTIGIPAVLDNIELIIWGYGDTSWGDPRDVCTRILSRHIVWLCRQNPMTAKQIAAQLNVPTIYIEEELTILTRGANGKYGLLRRLDDGSYIINFILLDKKAVEKAQYIYITQLLELCDAIEKFILDNKQRFLSFPYLNHKPDWNQILWQQISAMSRKFSQKVAQILEKKYFSGITPVERPFSVYGYEYNETDYGCGLDSIHASSVCGYDEVHIANIYLKHIKAHFMCGHNIAHDPLILLALRAIDGISFRDLSEEEQKHANEALTCGYLYREGDTLYTKILVSNISDEERLYEITDELAERHFAAPADRIAADIARLIYEKVPEHLLGEWKFANILANHPILESLVDALIDKGILTAPENGIGAEGCWMSVK